jgi:hypothetical protein
MSETLESKEQRSRTLWLCVFAKRVGTKKPTESPARVAESEVAGQ